MYSKVSRQSFRNTFIYLHVMNSDRSFPKKYRSQGCRINFTSPCTQEIHYSVSREFDHRGAHNRSTRARVNGRHERDCRVSRVTSYTCFHMSFFSTGSSSAVTNTSTAAPAAKDIEVSDPPPDSVSSLAWSPQADFLAAGSWDNNVRIYEVSPGGQTQVSTTILFLL